MRKASMLLMAIALASCKSVSLGGNGDAGGQLEDASGSVSGSSGAAGSGGQGGTGPIDAPGLGGQGGGASGTGSCQPRNFDVDCAFGAAIYTCVARGGGWEWTHSCPGSAKDGGPIPVDSPTPAQHPYVSAGAACINYPVSGYRVFPYDPSLRGNQTWPLCTLNCTKVTPVFGPAGTYPPLDQALPTGTCEDEGATCDSPAMTGWCAPCANGGGPGNGYTCVCRGHNWHCALVSLGMNVCQGKACLNPPIPEPASCATTTWTEKQICTCGVCRDLCDSDAQCPSGRCKLNQVCRPSSDKCAGPDECSAPCKGLCEAIPDGGTVDSAPVAGCDPVKAAQALSAAGLTAVGEAQTLKVDLPSDLAASANWGVKQTECREGGYDLSAVAGKSVCLVSFGTTQLCQSQPANAWVVMSDGLVRCIYQAVRPDSPMTPGVYSVHDPVCSSPDAAAPSCPGTNLAARTCRTSASDCIPSSCTCASNGTWSCTTDCRSLPLCSDGGTCPDARIDSSKAAAAFTQFMRQRNPDMNPTVTYGAEEKTVPNLWEVMRAQLFFGKAYLEDGSTSQEIAFLYRKCAVSSLLTDDLWFGLIDSGVVANGAFYYSWGWGSGIYRSNLGKLVANETSLVKSTSPSYFNPSSGPPGLVVALEGGKLVVYRATVYWGKFNEWSNPERMGLLKDFGDRLALVDDNGKELSTTLP